MRRGQERRHRRLRHGASAVVEIVPDPPGPTDFTTQASAIAIDTFIPVAHGPSANAFTSTNVRGPSVPRARNWVSLRVEARSTAPRTQFVGVPVEPEDSSITTPCGGMRPPWQSCSIT